MVAPGPSNMCVDAAICGTPSCYLTAEGFDYAHPLPYRAGPEGIAEVIKQAMDSRGDPLWGDFCKHYNAAHPAGGAVERVVEMVRRICI